MLHVSLHPSKLILPKNYKVSRILKWVFQCVTTLFLTLYVRVIEINDECPKWAWISLIQAATQSTTKPSLDMVCDLIV